MTYLIGQIWVLLAVAAALGLGFGLAAGSRNARRAARIAREAVDQAEQAAARHRDDAAQAAAQVQTLMAQSADYHSAAPRAFGAPSASPQLEAELERARAAAARDAATAQELRQRLARLEASGDADRVAMLQGENQRLRAALEAAQARAPAAATSPTAGHHALDAMGAGLSEASDAARLAADAAHWRERAAELEARQEDLEHAAAQLEALEAGRAAAFDPEHGASSPHWLAARNQWLEFKLAEVAGQGALTPPDAEAELIALRARVAELENYARMARPGASAPDQTLELERLRWRNQYLASRVTHLESRDPDTDSDPNIVETERLRARVAELEAAATRDQSAEVARLRERVGELEAGAPAAGQTDRPTSLTWRNRYLTSRVEYLERRVADLETPRPPEDDDAGEVASLRAQLAGMEAQAEEAARLRQRLHEMEAKGTIAGPAVDEKSADRDHALEWRNRYLNSRVKYLEDQLASLRRDADPASPAEGG